MRYRDGYDGQVAENFSIQLPKELWPKDVIMTEFICVDMKGVMVIASGYAWDYATVPTKFFHWLSNKIAGRKSKVPSLVHDALCQLHRNGYLPMDPTRLHTDTFFYLLLLERKFLRVRAITWFKAVRLGAKYAKQKPKEVHTAP